MKTTKLVRDIQTPHDFASSNTTLVKVIKCGDPGCAWRGLEVCRAQALRRGFPWISVWLFVVQDRRATAAKEG